MKFRFAYIPLLAFLGLVGLFAAPLLEGKDPAVIPSAMIGKPVPKFDLAPALPFGKGVSTATLVESGVPSIVNVFASWCISCHSEQQLLVTLKKETGVALYGIDYKDKRPDAEAWLKRYGNPFDAVGFDGAGRSAIDWGVYGVPETYVVDKAGIIRYKYVGALNEDTIDTIVKPLLKELSK